MYTLGTHVFKKKQGIINTKFRTGLTAVAEEGGITGLQRYWQHLLCKQVVGT